MTTSMPSTAPHPAYAASGATSSTMNTPPVSSSARSAATATSGTGGAAAAGSPTSKRRERFVLDPLEGTPLGPGNGIGHSGAGAAAAASSSAPQTSLVMPRSAIDANLSWSMRECSGSFDSSTPTHQHHGRAIASSRHPTPRSGSGVHDVALLDSPDMDGDDDMMDVPAIEIFSNVETFTRVAMAASRHVGPAGGGASAAGASGSLLIFPGEAAPMLVSGGVRSH
jgi:hypothetical protein